MNYKIVIRNFLLNQKINNYLSKTKTTLQSQYHPRSSFQTNQGHIGGGISISCLNIYYQTQAKFAATGYRPL
jgi:hypothetical protein